MIRLSSLCVYCGAATGDDPAHRAVAEAFGHALGARGVRLVYGGGRVGLMGVLADAAIAAGGSVTGIIPRHLYRREAAHGAVDELIVVDSMHARKSRMFALADAFVALPGGLGTLDETIEVITWRQLGLHDKPIVILDANGYWKPLIALVEHAIAAGFARAEARRLFAVVSRVEDVFAAIAAAESPRVSDDRRRF